jgi:hypothetical protein
VGLPEGEADQSRLSWCGTIVHAIQQAITSTKGRRGAKEAKGQAEEMDIEAERCSTTSNIPYPLVLERLGGPLKQVSTTLLLTVLRILNLDPVSRSRFSKRTRLVIDMAM